MKNVVKGRLIFTSVMGIALSASFTACKTVGSGTSGVAGAYSIQTDDAPQIARFTVLLDQLDKGMKGLTCATSATQLAASDSVNIVGSLEALGRIYEKDDAKFVEITKVYGDLGALIQDYKDWIAKEAKAKADYASADIITKVSAKRAEACAKLEAYLKSSKLIPGDQYTKPYNDSLRDWASDHKWKDVETDRRQVLAYMRGLLNVIRNKHYDFNRMESGNGLHQFGRDMRWISWKMRSLNGMVTLGGSACRWNGYIDTQDAITSSYLATLNGSSAEASPVKITDCYYHDIARKAVTLLNMKSPNAYDPYELNGKPDTVSDTDKIGAQSLVTGIKETRLFDLLESELVLPMGAMERTGIKFVNVAEPKYCLNSNHVNGKGAANIYLCKEGEGDQNFNVIYTGGGHYYRWYNEAQGQCMNLSTNAYGSSVDSRPCDNSETQSWNISSMSNAWDSNLVYIINAKSNADMCVSLDKASDAANVVTKKCNLNDKSQLWSISYY